MTIVKTFIMLINVKEIVSLQNPFIIILCYRIKYPIKSHLRQLGLYIKCENVLRKQLFFFIKTDGISVLCRNFKTSVIGYYKSLEFFHIDLSR